MAIANMLGIDTSYSVGHPTTDTFTESTNAAADLFGLNASASSSATKPGFSSLALGASTGSNASRGIGMSGMEDSQKSALMSPTMPSLLTQSNHDATSQTDTIVNEALTLIVNGMQLMRVKLPTHVAGSTSKGTMHVIPSTLKACPHPSTVGHGGLDSRQTPISLLVYGANVALERESSIQAFARFTGEGHQHDIQFKDLTTRMDTDMVTDVINFVPTHVTLHLKYHATCIVRDEEQEVLEALREIIADEKVNPRGGSITSALANDHLKDKLPNLYEMVIKGKHGNLENFLNAHSDVFTLFTFSDKAIKKKTVSPEPRIVLKPGQRELCTNLPMTQSEVRLHEHLLDILGNKDMDKRDLLDQLSNDMTFATFLSPTLSILMRFLSRHKDRFVWSMDPDKPTVVGLQGRQHDSESLGYQADLDKQIAAPTKKWNGKGGEKGDDVQASQDRMPAYEAKGGEKGAKGGKGGKGNKGRGRGGKDGDWGSKGAYNQRGGYANDGGYILNGQQQGVQVINANAGQLHYQYAQAPMQQQQAQFQQIVMPQQQFMYDNQIKAPGLPTDDVSVLDMIGSGDGLEQLYGTNPNPQDLVATPEGSFVFVEQGQDRQAQAQQDTVFLHEVRFVNGNTGASQVSPVQQPLLMQSNPPLFTSAPFQQVPTQTQGSTRLAQSALPFTSQLSSQTTGSGVGT